MLIPNIPMMKRKSEQAGREYVISKYSDVDKVGKILYKKPCAAAIFFADNGKPVRKNINGKIQRVIFKNHAAISGEVFRYKNLYDVYYYAHSNPRNDKRFDKKGKRQYYSIKDYLKKYKGARVYICVLKWQVKIYERKEKSFDFVVSFLSNYNDNYHTGYSP